MTKPIELGFRPSPQQLRAWRLQDGATSCSILCALRIEGNLDRRALRRALAATVARHEILRTAFRLPAGLSRPLQVILEPEPVPLPEVDFRDLSLEHRSAGATALLSALAGPPFDLERGEGWRAALVRLGPCEHKVLFALSATCADPGAFEPLAADLLAAYARQVAAGEHDPEPPLQYVDVAEWQNNLLEGEDAAEGIETWREYWRAHDIDTRMALPLPLQESEATPGPFAPREVPVPLARETAGALTRLAEVWGCPPQVLLLTAWKAVIQRGIGRDETLVGVLYSGRHSEELKGVIGPLARYLPIAARFSSEFSLREAMSQVRQAMKKAETWGEYFNWEHVAGNAHGAGGFPVCFEVGMNDWKLAVDGLRAESELSCNSATLDSFALALSCNGEGENLRLALRYDPRRFSRKASCRLAGRLAALLGSAASQPDAALAHHPAMAQEELSHWLELSVAPPAADRSREGKTLAAVFEEQVDRAPDRLAVVAGDSRLTFRELDVWANRLAHHLRAAGARPEVPVALCLERSAEAVAAILAVWKAGAFYVPLDPTQPAERLAYLLEDTKAPLLVTDSRLASGLPGAGDLPDVRTVRLDEEAAALALRPANRPAGKACPRSLAYTIYTSGSTGRPKGVQVEHRSALHLLAALEGAVLDPLAESDLCPDSLLVSLNAPMIFDASVQQLALLLAGHALCVVPQDIRTDGTALLAFLREQEVNLLDCTPSQLRLLVNAGLLDGPDPRFVLTAGEAVDEPLWRRLVQAERTVCVNLYGPTECSVDATFRRIEPGSTTPTIGRPLPGYEAFLLDRTLQPVPLGAPGELCLGGRGLARGYLHRPDLTAKLFVPHFLAKLPGERLYRTGDLGRHLPNGDLEFLGRLDHQVKIRGFRIELGEIEAVLVEQAGVREAVVVAHESATEDRRLVAYIIGDTPVDALRQALRQRLPDYMLPAAFVTLAALPLTPNGKVDRKALPSPEWQSAVESYVAPRTPVEEVLAGIWADLLGLERIGATDSFFDLGGHSLLATRVMSRLRSAFGIEMPLRNLFEAPVLTELATRVEAVLRAGASRLTPPLVPLPREESLPLSFAQQRLWFINQLEPASSLYNMPVALRVEGPLDSEVLVLCLGEIVRRHETLRTVFAASEGSPVQVIQPASPFGLVVVDLSGLPEDRCEALALTLAGEEAGRPFDLRRGPLLRGLLLRLTESVHIVALTMHHIVSDGWSMGILVREIMALYPVFTEGKNSFLPELPVQYADFAAWQSSWLQGETLESEIAFWRQRLAGLPPLLEFPTDRPRPAVQSFRGAARPVRLSPGLIRQAQTLSRQEGVTLFMMLLAGFQALLARYSRQDDLAVGTPVAGRNRVEIEELIGFFVNTLVLRGDLSGEPSFRDLLGRARDTTLDAYLHQEVPFEKLVQEISPDRSLSHTPLFQAVLALQNTPDESLKIQNLRLHPLYAATTTAKFDLTLYLQEWNGGLSGTIDYSTDLFDAATIDRLIIHYERLLASALASLEQPVSELPLLSATECHQLSAEWGGAAGEEPPTAPTLQSCFEAQARRAPDAPALTYGGATISYGMLNRRSNQLACWLRRHGVGPESRVGLCMERSLDLIVGILGILKSGGAYVPLDPGYPQERLAHMIEDAGVRIVVGTKEPVATLPGTAKQILLDAHRELLETLPAEDLEPLIDGANLAYVIYTSGSTGLPKGTLVSNGNVARLFDATKAWFSFGDRDAWTLFHSYAFDFSVWEIWGALLYGGRLVIVPHNVSRSPELFLDLLVRERITVLNQTPSAFAQFAKADEERGGVTTDLRLVIFGGEALDPAGLAPWFARHGDERPLLVNMYGITETTVHVTYRRLRAADARSERRSVIGVPIPDLALAVMDHPWLQPVPIGVPGELVVGGAGLSRGYLGRPELTAERFVPNPVGGRSGARLYRSGDLGRFLPHGDVEYLGRIDQQVKIRGFRIEPGEIEAALAALAGVREAVVMVRKDGTGSPRLVAYVVAEGGSAVGITEVREQLSSRLPGFMVPSTFVFLDALPLNANAKVDRRALPEPDWRHLNASKEFSAPETTKEKVLADVWAEVLGVERVGVHDNFFHLGGDSIRSIVANARAEKRGVAFSIQQLFEHPVLRDLARVAEEQDSAAGPGSTAPFELLTEADRARLPKGVEDAYPLATLQAGMLFHSEVGEGTAIFHDLQSVHVRAPFVPDWMRETVRQVSLLHPVLRTSFDLASFSESLQLVHTGTNVPFEVHDLRQVPPDEQEAVLSEWLRRERLRAFVWTRPPLVAFHVHLRGEASFLFTLSFHHAVLDGWSAASLLADLFRRYALFLRGEEPPPDAPLAVAYRDFVALERAAIFSEEARTFWGRMLDGAEPARLPRLSAPDSSPGLATEIRRIQPHIDPALSAGAQRVAREAEVPLKSLLLAVFLRALSDLSGTRDALTALISHGRPEHADGERALGLFLNTLPFQVNLRGGRWCDLAREVFDLERRMLPFRRFPFAEMQRMQGRSLMLETAFNYLHFHIYQGTVGTREIEVLGSYEYEETNFPLLTYFSLDPLSQHLQMRLCYSTSEMDTREVERFADYLLRALTAVVTDPASRYDVPLYSAAERHQVLTEWNDTAAQISWKSIPTQIRKLIDRTPEAVAAVFETESLTYAELGDRADRLGHHLRKLGCGPESRVGVALERTPDLLVALLGVLEAGAVYVPLDPEYPRERLTYLLENARPVALVTQEYLRNRLPLPDTLPVLIPEALPEANGVDTSEVPEELGDHLLAYTIYTSGSTGRPKGVMVPCTGMINHLHAKISYLGLDKDSRVAQTASQCFDISVWQFLAPLLAGGSVHIANELTVHDPELLLRFVAHERITILEIVPSLLSGILESLTAAGGTIDLSSLQWMIVTGEACPQGLADRWLSLAPHTRLLNAYGPTECSDDVTHYERTKPEVSTSRSLPIGKPIANTRIYVLDPSGYPTPQGVTGEICVTGRGVGRGYLDLPERTANVFLPDPWSKEPGRRLYRTGDLGRWLSDGTMECLGRLDHQVKVRGFRIELGEIEAALIAQTGVREAVVVAREEIPGDRRLVAYVVGEAAADFGAEDALRRSLRERLPDYMVPAAFVTLVAMPLTSNGKVDRKALPAPEWQSDQASSAPRTPVEEVLAGIWAEVLGLEQVGATDNFFDLGGHSLLATRVTSRLRSAFGVELPLRDLFEAPRLADLAARVETALRDGAGPMTLPLVPVPREGSLSLSFAQQRLWFIDQLESGRPIYNMPVALRVEGPLRTAVLALCLGEIERRHEALRTIFAPRDGKPVQVIRPAASFNLPVVDLSGLPESGREALALCLAAEEASLPFDLAQGPLFRGLLLRLAEENHFVALTMHHIVSDGWSMGILVREVGTLYASFAERRPSTLPELPVQYADFAVWQHSWLHGEVLENEISFWRRQLAGLPPLLELSTDRPRPAVQSYRGATRLVRLTAELTRQAQSLGRREGATLFMALLASFQALLARYSGQDDLAVGTPVAGRNRVEIEGLIGFFANTLVMRGDVAGNPTFRELLGRVRKTALAAHTHQDVPFEKLVQELAPERSLAHTPLFQVMLVLQNAPVENLEIENLRLQTLRLEGTTAKFDLTLSLSEHDGGLIGTVEHATDLYDGTTADRLIGHFERLLAAAVSTPDEPACALPLSSPEEREQILIEWNDTAAPSVPRAWVYELFEAQVRRTPEAVAVVFRNEELTYTELGARAGHVAERLRRLGVGPDVPVGLLVERSLDMVAGVLGILQAGAAYVPLDPAYPLQRLTFMLDDTRAPVLLTQKHLRGRLPAESAQVLLLDGDDSIPAEGGVTADAEAAADNLAYVIYTSGSTGRPKGVALSHRALRNLIDWHLATLLGKARTLQFASLSFDASFHEMFACWATGGTLVVVPEELRRDMAALAELLVEQRIEKAILPVVVLQQLAEIFAGRENLPPLREITTTGERLQTNRAMAALLRRLPGCAFHNHYGPSETHVATAFTLHPEPEDWPVYPPVGRPIGNSSTYVLEPGLAAAPIGVPGDLYIGGACLARGYLRRPELTAEKFVPDSFGGEPGARLYRTGDKVRLLARGDLEFLGRFDDQVKIRGFRIELGEIESLLLSLPGVREAAVVVREDRSENGPGERRLVAYVTGDVAVDALRQSLRERLPDYMVPAAFVTLAALPLTTNGKVDRKALPAPERQSSLEMYLAPRTPVEEILAGIWAEVLGLERVGTADHFFDLGGHSLLVTQVMSRLRSAFGIEMPLRNLFAAPRLADLAAQVEVVRRTGKGLATPPLIPVPREGLLPLSFAQQRLWFLHQMDSASPVYNMPFAFRLSGPLDAPALAASLTEVVRRHETLRTTLVLTGDEPVQSIAPPAPQPLPFLDLAALPAAAREALALRLGEEEAARPFDLARPPVVRTFLLRLSGSDHVLLFTIHHVSGDGWSAEVLARDLVELYEAAVEGRASRLPALPVQYADFAVWQRNWLHGEVLAAQIEYWRRQLSGAPPLLEMPLDRPRPPVQSSRGGRRRLRLPAGLAASLASLGRREGATGFMVLLAGFQALLHRYSGQESVVVGTPIANRERTEVEGLIGFFANTLALRARFADDPGFAVLLAQIREASLGAYAHQDLPFEKLVDELAPQRDMSYAAVFQALFIYQNAPQQQPRLRELSLLPFGTDGSVARFDLTLACAEASVGLAVTLDYNADLFEVATADRLLRLFAHLLAQVVAEPRRPVGELPLLDDAEHRQVVLACNATAREWAGGDLCLHGLIARQAVRTPEAPAVIAEDGVLHFGDLAGWAGRIAGRLRELGVGAEDRVGVCLERSGAALAALIGALGAGAAYVPLDPEWPRERLAAVAADAGLAAMLTRSGLNVGGGLSPREVIVEELREGAPADLSRVRPVSPEAAAYVIYTSGSSGGAKGVVVSHRAAANFVLSLGETLGLAPSDRLLLFAPLSFDASVLQIFPALSRGAAVVVHADPREIAGAELTGFCERHGVTVLDLPAALWRQWIEDMAAEGRTLPAGIRTFLTGGESVPVERLRAWAGLTRRPAVFLSSYGPTEATVTATVFLTDSGTAASQPSGKVPIGRPLPNVRTYILDARMHPVPAGVAGELYLAGDGLARGYLGRPELTAASFLPDAHSGTASGRLYRTGDLARRLPGGDLEFLGRADTQVKIRGFRLELAEVETVLGRHPDLAECVVTVREDRPGDRRLVAYAVPQSGAAPGVSELRSFVAEQLPRFMVPAAFVLLNTLPLLASGKVDRGALPAPESDRPELDSSYSDPRTPAEETLAALWAQVLHLDRVGVHDNFFELGGDSILSIQILARANQMGMRLTARQIFEYPTVAELARVAASAPVFAAEQGIVTGAVPLTPIQRWFFAQGFTAAHHFNQATLLDLTAPLAPSTLERAVAALAGHHDALRMRFPREDRLPRQENAGLEAVVTPLWIDLSALSAAPRNIARVAAQEALQASFDLERGPLTRLAVFDSGAEGRRLLWVAHHLVVDGVSWRVLHEDLETACRLVAEGRPPALPAKTTSFRVWAERLVGHARSGGCHEELPYWISAVEETAARLPVDFPAGWRANTVESGLSVNMTLDPEETRTLLQVVPVTYRTQINDALLTALARAFAAWTGSPALVVDLEGHGREPLLDDVDLSRTVGWFTTQFPVRLDLAGTADVVDALHTVKEQLRRVPGHGIGYGLLVYEGGPEAEPLRTAPPAQVSFNYLGQFDQLATGENLFRLTGESTGAVRAPYSHRTHLIEVGGLVAGGRLQLGFGYSSNLHRRETIERLAASFGAALRDLITRCRMGEEATPITSDFPLVHLDEESFRKIAALLDEEE